MLFFSTFDELLRNVKKFIGKVLDIISLGSIKSMFRMLVPRTCQKCYKE